MTGRSLQASPKGIEQAATALNRNSLNKKVLAEELELALSTVTNFFGGKPVDRLNFEEICKKLGLDWREIVARPPGQTHLNSPENIHSVFNFTQRYM